MTFTLSSMLEPQLTEHETAELLWHDTSDFIRYDFGPSNSPDLNPVDYKIRESRQKQWGTLNNVDWWGTDLHTSFHKVQQNTQEKT